MTDEQLRKIDALICEKVFGGKPVFRNVDTYDEIDCHMGMGSKDWVDETGTCNVYNEADFDRLKYYSTDIAAAWEIIEKVPLLIELQSPGAPCNDTEYENLTDQWRAEARLTINGRCVYATGNTAPHVICLAALKALS